MDWASFSWGVLAGFAACACFDIALDIYRMRRRR